MNQWCDRSQRKQHYNYMCTCVCNHVWICKYTFISRTNCVIDHNVS